MKSFSNENAVVSAQVATSPSSFVVILMRQKIRL